MSGQIEWEQRNDQFLQASLTLIRLKLRHFISRNEPLPQAADHSEVAALVESIERLANIEPAPALLLLSQQFGLSRFEQDTLLLCVAMELDPALADDCALAHRNPKKSYPTFALALSLFENPAWDILSPHRPLRHWRLLEVLSGGVEPLTTTALRADERIVSYVKGLNFLDARLTTLMTPLKIGQQGQPLPPSQQKLVTQAEQFLARLPEGEQLPLIQLLGIDKDSKQLVGWHVAAALGLQLYYLSLDLIPAQTDELESFARLWQRESLLLPIALYIDTDDVGEILGEPSRALGRFLSRSEGVFFIGTRDVQQDLHRASLDLDVAKPTAVEQQASWTELLGKQAPWLPAQLAGQFNLGLALIQDVAQAAAAEAPAGEEALRDFLWQGCLVRTRPRLDTLAERLEPKATWQDIVLPDHTLAVLHEIANQVRQRGKVYEDWGFRQRRSRGLGMITLFAGESGTGKTMAAEVIANDLQLNLYRIDLSAVVSKYIGETEKNLRRLFDAAEDGGAILFFDEADALFGKRSQVKDSHDRYANIETNYLLQRMEAYQGLAILATNMKSGLDDAFTRRLRFILNFPIPDAEDRQRIWQQVFPPETPLAALDYCRLAEFNLPGGSIYNAALNAAFLAAQEGGGVAMPHVLRAILTEFHKSDRLIDDSKFIWDEPA